MNAPSRPHLGVEIVLIGLGCAMTGLLYKDFFAGGYLPPLLWGAAGATVLARVAAARLRGAGTLLAAVLGFVVFAAFLVFPGTLEHGLPTRRTVSELAAGLLHGWTHMLSVGLPAGVSPDLLVTPALVSWSAAFASVALAVRTEVVLAPAVPVLLAFALGLLFTADATDGELGLAAAFLFTLLLLVLARSARLTTADRRGMAVRGLPIIAVVTVAGALGADLVPLATGASRFTLRDVVPQPVEVADTLNPLATLKNELRGPVRELFTVRVDANDTGRELDRLRTAALDDFDGTQWTTRDSFTAPGRTLAADPGLADPRRVELRLSVRELAGPYLPAAGWPIRTDARGVGFSARSGTLVTTAPSPRGLAYAVTGLLCADDARLRRAGPDLAGRNATLPSGLPREMQEMGARLTATAPTAYTKLAAIESYLRGLPYRLDAPPGHSYAAVRRLFAPDPRDRAGYAEQHAAAFAVLARSQGFPARVAVGYLLRPQRRRAGTYTVTSKDAHAWAEVRLSGSGWVTFDPTDVAGRSTPGPAPPREAAATPDTPRNTPPGTGAVPIEDPSLAPRRDGSGPPGWPPLPLVVLTPLPLAAAIILVAKRRRRRRRRRGSPAARIAGAWAEVTDRLITYGVDVPQSLTAHEVAKRARVRLGGPAAPVTALAPIATAAAFAPVAPDEDAVRTAWELDSLLGNELRRSRHPLDRVRAWLDPRPLLASRRDRKAMEGLWGE